MKDYEKELEEYREVMETIKEREKNLDKIKGSLFGGAMGDALGYPVEFMSIEQIREKYGKDGIHEYTLDKKSGLALISDDTQMTLFTANGILVADTRLSMRGVGGRPIGYVICSYLDWLLTQQTDFETSRKMKFHQRRSWLLDVPELYSRRSPGNTCISSLIETKNSDRHYWDFMKKPINKSKGCGAVMRIAPLGLFEYYVGIETLDEEAALISAITHGHSLGYMTSSVLVHIINRIVYPQKETSTLKEIVEEARDCVYKIFKKDKHINELRNIINLAIRLSENDKSDIENISKIGEGWVAEETLAIAIYCSLRYQNDFSKAIIAAVNHSGDSDSTGAVTGNIAGAVVGYEKIEDKWKHKLELSDVISEIATDLCHGCRMCDLGYYHDMDWERKYVYMRWKENI